MLGLKREAKTTIVSVTHNIPSATALGDELVFLHEGRVLARGTASDLERSADPMVRAFMRARGHSG